MTKFTTKQDARGQFAPSQADRKSDGVASATPRAGTGNDDAAVEDQVKKPSPTPRFDVRSQTNTRG